MAVLALAGFTGMFASHRGRLGRLGRAGYGLLTVGYLAMFAAECIIGYYLPTVAHSNPGYVQHVINAAMGHGPSGGIGPMRELFIVVGIGYSLGGLLFGIALFRAGVLARWASLLLAYGTTSALALSVLPESFDRPFAVPTGVALIGLGISLWRDQRNPAAELVHVTSGLEPVAAALAPSNLRMACSRPCRPSNAAGPAGLMTLSAIP